MLLLSIREIFANSCEYLYFRQQNKLLRIRFFTYFSFFVFTWVCESSPDHMVLNRFNSLEHLTTQAYIRFRSFGYWHIHNTHIKRRKFRAQRNHKINYQSKVKIHFLNIRCAAFFVLLNINFNYFAHLWAD